jgi:hypothetical protein
VLRAREGVDLGAVGAGAARAVTRGVGARALETAAVGTAGEDGGPGTIVAAEIGVGEGGFFGGGSAIEGGDRAIAAMSATARARSSHRP